MKILKVLLVVCFFSTIVMPAYAQVDLEMLLQRVERLEAENRELRNEVNSLKGKTTYSSSKRTYSSSVEMPSVTTGSDTNIKVYGFLKTSAFYDDSGNQDLRFYVNAEEDTNGSDHFGMVTEDSRIGFAFDGPEFGVDGKINGKLEADFWGGDLRIRHAYVDVTMGDWNINFGQSWTFIAPLGMHLFNFGTLGWGGNLALRDPQLVITKKFDDVFGGTYKAKIGAIDTQNSTQRDSGIPVFGTYHSLDTKLFGKPFHIALSGFYGEEDPANGPTASVRGAVVGMKLKLHDKVSLATESYFGANLDEFFSSPGASAGIYNNKSIKSRGGFITLTVKPMDKVTVNGGVGIDDVYTDNVVSSNVWDYNYTYYTNFNYSITKNVLWGIEYQYFKTKWFDSDRTSGDANRIQTSIIYKF